MAFPRGLRDQAPGVMPQFRVCAPWNLRLQTAEVLDPRYAFSLAPQCLTLVPGLRASSSDDVWAATDTA